MIARMAKLNANGIQIEYDSFGDRGADPLLLIMGLGAQMILWDEEFCTGLADHGHFVVRFDNRDVGLSTKFEHLGAPNLPELMQNAAAGGEVKAPYLLDDMADDAAGVLDSLDIETAHIVGASMGGMIAQTFAIRHPSRLRTLTSIMSSTGNPELPAAKPEAMAVLMRERAKDREGAIEAAVSASHVLTGPGFEVDVERVRERAARGYDRCFHPEGQARQLAAILASGSRKTALAQVRTPTLVIHGDGDPLVPIEGGHDTAESIPGAEMLIIEGMGHDLPREAWPRIISAISDHARKAPPAV
jgi:pimeloyl-ACP methyl ester carboxylesterase